MKLELHSRAAGTAFLALLLLLGVAGQVGVNEPPTLDPIDVYRAFEDYAIALPIPADDPEGGPLTFTSDELPAGASLDESSGLFSWTPASDQVGAWTIAFTVSDDADIPESTEGELLIQVSPLDACSVPTCDAALGCDFDLVSIDQDCCPESEPLVSPAEPEATCPEGRVMYVGRNRFSFGRLQSCNLAQTTIGLQGGKDIDFNLEARCINASEPVAIHVELETAEYTLVPNDRADSALDITMTERGDGFYQKRGIRYTLPLNDEIPPLDLEGQEAELRVRLTDTDGVVLERHLRVVLTLEELTDLPDPQVEDDVPADEAGCVGCHRPFDEHGQRFGVEEAHPWHSLACVDCHGGDGAASTRAAAHISRGDGPSFLKNLSSDQLDGIDPAYLRFVNPGDLRIADQTCGLAGCHPEHVENVKLSTMSTFGGHYALPRYLAGMQGRVAEVAAVDVVDTDFDAGTAPSGAIEQLAALRGPHPEVDRASIPSVLDDYLPKACPTCHLNSFGRNGGPGMFRSSGCTACHMVSDYDGTSQSEDPAIPAVKKAQPSHPVRHELTTAIPTEQCGHCHFQGGRIGLSYRGIREGGFSAEKTPEHAVPYPETIYGHAVGFYFTDEDDTNEVDETPPDLHMEAGMVCMDCHVGVDVHGDGNLYASERHQVGIRCEDCHGSVREPATPDADGVFETTGGSKLRRMRRLENGAVLLRLSATGKEKLVPQVATLLASFPSKAMVEAMGVDDSGYSHTDSMECYTCHNTWRPTCFGCHVTMSDEGNRLNLTTGERTPGTPAVTRDDYSTEFLALGMNERGKLSPLCASMSMFFGYIDEEGTTHFEDRIRRTADGKKGFGWNPFHHHTTQVKPVGCEQCHPTGSTSRPDNGALLDATYGFGAGGPLVQDDEGVLHDVTQFLDDEGQLIAGFPHPGTGPVPADMRERAMAVVIPEPSPAWLQAAALLGTAFVAGSRRRASRLSSPSGITGRSRAGEA